MPQAASPSSNDVGLPPGYQLDESESTGPALPKGYQLDEQGAPAVPSAPAQPQVPFMEQIGNRIEDVAYKLPVHMWNLVTGQEHATPEEIAGARGMIGADQPTTMGKVAGALTAGPRMVYEQARQYYQHPATLAGDVILAAPELGEMRLPREGRLRVPAPPPETAGLSPEQQAKYTSALDKANADYAQQVASEASARAKWVSKSFQAKQSQAAAEAVSNQREALARGQEALSRHVLENVQNTHESVRNSLNARWEGLREKVGDVLVPTDHVHAAIENSRAMLAGVPEDLKIFNQIVKATSSEPVPEAIPVGLQGEEIDRYLVDQAMERPERVPEPIPFQNARIQYSALGEAWSRASGNMRRALRNVYDAYGNVLQTAADQAGAGKEYAKLRGDWHQYMQDWQGKGPLARVLQAPHHDYVTPIATGKSSDLLAETMGRYRKAGALPQSVAQVRRMAEQAKGLPRARVTQAPPKYEAKTPELAEVQRPVPKEVEPEISPILKKAGRFAGKMAGGFIGGKFGHPIIGYGVGGEIGAGLTERALHRPRSMPPSSEEYTRQLLRAKEGETSPGNADRIINKLGGSTKIRRLFQPEEPPED